MADIPYVTDTWNGLPHYVCSACGYDTMLLTRMTDHAASCPAVEALSRAPIAPESTPPPDSAGPRPEPPQPEPEPVPVPDDDEDDEPEPEVQA